MPPIPRIMLKLEKAILYASLTFIIIITILLRILPTRFGFYITEFDPYLQLYATKVIVKNILTKGVSGFFSFFTHHISNVWYPEGVDLGSRYYPGVPYLGAISYLILKFLGFSVSVEDVVLWIPVVMSVIMVLTTYYIGKILKGEFVGLLSALFFSLFPTFIARSTIGWYDTECLGMPMFLFSILFYLLALKGKDRRQTAIYAFLSGLTGGIMGSSWGAFTYLIVLYSIFPFIVIFSNIKISDNLKLTHIISLVIMLIIINSVPRNKYNYIFSLIALLAYISIILVLIKDHIKINKLDYKYKLLLLIVTIILVISIAMSLMTVGVTSKYLVVVNPFVRTEAVFVTTVQEQATVNVGAFLYNLNIMIPFLIFGVYILIKDLNIFNLFIIVMLFSTIYAASNFARLFILVAPVASIVSAYTINYLVSMFYMYGSKGKRKEKLEKTVRMYLFIIIILFIILFSLFNYSIGIRYAAAIPPTIASAGTQISANVDDWLEALAWIRENTPEDAVIAAWWDYGYWISFIANRTSLADNGTLNITRIKILATMFLSNESEALKILKELGADYVLIFIGTQKIPYGERSYYVLTGIGEDSKFIQMARIVGIPENHFIYSAEERVNEKKPFYKDTFWNTFLGKLIPYKYVTTQIDQNGRLIDIYEYTPKYIGNAPLQLVFRSSHKVVGEVLIYKINYDN